MTLNSSNNPTEILYRGNQAVGVTLKGAQFVGVKGADKGKMFRVNKRKVTIGSSRECDLCLNDPAISRLHAVIETTDEGFLLKDLDSTNGTYYEGLRVRELFLAHRAELQFGNSVYRFEESKERIELAFSKNSHFGEIIGISAKMRELFGLLERIAPTDATIVITGETGTGKGAMARAIHEASRRAQGPFIVCDLPSIPGNLMESELFGHEKGAFTGATQSRLGAFECANGGTIFLDELGELPLELQPKLLRVLEEKEIKPVGSNRTRKVDARVIAATNRNLEEMVAKKLFREDLFYRLNVFQLALPPLRERVEDIPLIAKSFLIKNEISPKLAPELSERLTRFSWPGNVRQLRNFIERLVVLGNTEEAIAQITTADYQRFNGEGWVIDFSEPFKMAKQRLIDRFESEYLRKLLATCRGNVSLAARQAGIDRMYIHRMLKRHGIQSKQPFAVDGDSAIDLSDEIIE